jgi:hypothetical protein
MSWWDVGFGGSESDGEVTKDVMGRIEIDGIEMKLRTFWYVGKEM